jgi:hypothetical protein
MSAAAKKGILARPAGYPNLSFMRRGGEPGLTERTGAPTAISASPPSSGAYANS